MTASDEKQFIQILEKRFKINNHLHEAITWENVRARLAVSKIKIPIIYAMEMTGGEPDVTGIDEISGEIIFMDCAIESPKGRRSLCYDAAALAARKEHKPKNSAIQTAKEIGIEILTETQYRLLQSLGKFDLKTSSWVITPENIRNLGGAIFCDRRYDTVFLYHNGADSYYAARGFRGVLKV